VSLLTTIASLLAATPYGAQSSPSSPPPPPPPGPGPATPTPATPVSPVAPAVTRNSKRKSRTPAAAPSVSLRSAGRALGYPTGTHYAWPTECTGITAIWNKGAVPQGATLVQAQSTRYKSEGEKRCSYIFWLWRAGATEPVSRSEGVEIRSSTIPGAGQGLFATTRFRKGETITWMPMRLTYNQHEEDRMRAAGRCIEDVYALMFLGRRVTACDIDVRNYRGRWCNSAPSSVANATCTEWRARHGNKSWASMPVTALRDINPGEEITWDYESSR
jgi:hypothetical protein